MKIERVILFILLFFISSCEKECRIYECETSNGIEKVNIINMDYYDESKCKCEDYFD